MPSKSELNPSDLIILVELEVFRSPPNPSLPIKDAVRYTYTNDGPVATFPCGKISAVKGSEPLHQRIARDSKTNYIIIRCPNLEQKLELKYGTVRINDIFENPGVEYTSGISLKLNRECREDMFNNRFVIINSNLRRGYIWATDRRQRFEYGLRSLNQCCSYYAYLEFEDSFHDLLQFN